MSENNSSDLEQQMTDLAEVEDAKLQNKGRSLSQNQLVLRRFFSHKPAVLSLIILVFCAVMAFSSLGYGPIPGWWDKTHTATGPVVDGGRPTMFQNGQILGEHPFGQTQMGQDYFAQVMYGMQQSLIIAFVVGIVSTIVGVVIGALAGFYRGWIETILMRLTDVVIVVPLLVIAAVAGQMVGGRVWLLALVLGLITWTGLARLVRAEILTLREKEYVAASIAMGSSAWRIILRHMVPNSIGVIIVNTTFSIAAAILLESALSFIGFGVRPPELSLGFLINYYEAASSTRPWLFWFPGIFIVLIALTVNFIGDGLRDAYDPRQKRVGDRRPGLLRSLGLRNRRAEERVAGAGDAYGTPGTATHPVSASEPKGNTMRFWRKK